MNRHTRSPLSRHAWSAKAGTGHGPTDGSLEARVGRKIEPQPDGCWLYNGKRGAYVQRSFGGTPRALHRWTYEKLHGPIPDGHILHHTCEEKGCCNPAHLVPMLQADHLELHAEMRRS